MDEEEVWLFLARALEELTLEEVEFLQGIAAARLSYMLDLRRSAALDRFAPGDVITFTRGVRILRAPVEAVTRRRLRVTAEGGRRYVDPLEVLEVESIRRIRPLEGWGGSVWTST